MVTGSPATPLRGATGSAGAHAFGHVRRSPRSTAAGAVEAGRFCPARRVRTRRLCKPRTFPWRTVETSVRRYSLVIASGFQCSRTGTQWLIRLRALDAR